MSDAGKSAAKKPSDPYQPEAVKGMTSSRAARQALIETSLESDGRVRNFRPGVAGFLGYPLAHHAHHRGQATMLARQLANPSPPKSHVRDAGVGGR